MAHDDNNYTSIQGIVDDHHEEQQKKKIAPDGVPFSKEAGPPSRTIEAPVMPEMGEDGAEQNELENFIDQEKENFELPDELKKAGLQTVGDNNLPAAFQNIHLPISDEKILNGHKAPITSSLRWLSEFCIYLLKQAHIGLKVVHGHVVRVIKR